MNVAGVRTNDGMVWADVGEHDVALLDDVIIRIDGAERQGTVVITPDQMLNPPEPRGEIIGVHRRAQSDLTCDELPRSHMPPLGSLAEVDGTEGTVVALDVPNGLVTVRAADIEWTLPASNLKDPEREDS